MRGPAILNASVYRTNVRDDIFFIQSENAVFEGFFDNIGDTRREGVELGVQVFPTERLSLYANYAFTRATFRSAADDLQHPGRHRLRGFSARRAGTACAAGDRLPLVPDHQVKVGGLLTCRSGSSSGWTRGTSASSGSGGTRPTRPSRSDGYFVANVRVGFSRAKWEISAVVTNLFDSHRPIFGTFNENRQTGVLERFLTPLNAPGVQADRSPRIRRLNR